MHKTKLQTEYEKKFYLKIFIFFRRCRWHRWQTFICDYLREVSQKICNHANGILRGSMDTDLWKKPEVENLVSDFL